MSAIYGYAAIAGGRWSFACRRHTTTAMTANFWGLAAGRVRSSPRWAAVARSFH